MGKSRLMEVWADCGQGVGNSLKELSKLTIQLEQTMPVYKMSGIGTHRSPSIMLLTFTCQSVIIIIAFAHGQDRATLGSDPGGS